jgi:hypothetical protein
MAVHAPRVRDHLANLLEQGKRALFFVGNRSERLHRLERIGGIWLRRRNRHADTDDRQRAGEK